MIDARFFRVAAVCSMLSAITTLMLIFLPEWLSNAQGFEALARVHELPYRIRAWAYLLHPFLVLTAALGIMFAIRCRSPSPSATPVTAPR